MRGIWDDKGQIRESFSIVKKVSVVLEWGFHTLCFESQATKRIWFWLCWMLCSRWNTCCRSRSNTRCCTRSNTCCRSRWNTRCCSRSNTCYRSRSNRLMLLVTRWFWRWLGFLWPLVAPRRTTRSHICLFSWLLGGTLITLSHNGKATGSSSTRSVGHCQTQHKVVLWFQHQDTQFQKRQKSIFCFFVCVFF